MNGIALSVTGDGTVHVVYERPGDLYHISKPSGGSWSAPYQFVTAANSQSAPDLAVVGDMLFVVWTDGRSGNDDIYSITRSNAGVWSLEEQACCGVCAASVRYTAASPSSSQPAPRSPIGQS